MKNSQNNDKLIDLTVEGSDMRQPDYTETTNVALKDAHPVRGFPLSEGLIKSELSPDDVSKAVDEASN